MGSTSVIFIALSSDLQPANLQAAMPPMLERIGIEDALDRLVADPGQRSAFNLAVDVFQAFDGFFDLGEGEIRAPEDLVALADPVFLGRDQRVPELPGAIEDSRDLAIDVVILARDDNAFLDPGMGHM